MTKLISLALRNFKGCQHRILEPHGNNIQIFGDNATGKTTIADAYSWLFFGKNSDNKKDFEIKTLDEHNNPIHNLEHEVDGELEVNGERQQFRKLYKEKWVKARSTTTAEFSGHTTDHWVNGVPVQEGEYNRQIAAICDPKCWQLLTDPTYASTVLPWQELRRILLEVTGDVTDQDVITSNPKLAPLPGIVGRRPMDDYKKIVVARRKECNAKIEGIPPRLDELSRGMPASTADQKKVAKSVEELRAKLATLTEQEARINAGGEVAEKTKELREAEAELQELRNKAAALEAERLNQVRQGRGEIDGQLAKIDAASAQARAHAEADRAARPLVEAGLAELREAFKLENARSFEFTGENVCAACGQNLPADKVEAARAKAEEEFNLAKSGRLERNIAEGKQLKARLETLGAQIQEREAEIARLEESRLPLQAKGGELVFPAAQEPDPRLIATEQRIDRIKGEIEQLREGTESSLLLVRQEQTKIREGIQADEQVLASFKEQERIKARQDELAAEQKQLAAEIEKIDSELFLLEEFIRTKVSLLTDRINGRFKIARFKLFETQINGALNEVCETMVNGVPYADLNTGARINVGLDIINTLADHYGFSPPVFIDGAESVTALIPTRGQQIRLVVSAPDKTLRVECAAAQPQQQELLAV